jgi:hypothetical protein
MVVMEIFSARLDLAHPTLKRPQGVGAGTELSV